MNRASINIVVRSKDGKLLLQMRDSKAPCNPLTWDFWGGGMEADENPCIAAARELSEELGISADPTDFSLFFEGSDERGNVYFMKFARELSWRDITVNEGAGAAFFELHDIPRIHVTDRVLLVMDKI